MWVQGEFPWELAGTDLHSAWSTQEASATLSYNSLNVASGSLGESEPRWHSAGQERGDRGSTGTNGSFPTSHRHR